MSEIGEGEAGERTHPFHKSRPQVETGAPPQPRVGGRGDSPVLLNRTVPRTATRLDNGVAPVPLFTHDDIRPP